MKCSEASLKEATPRKFRRAVALPSIALVSLMLMSSAVLSAEIGPRPIGKVAKIYAENDRTVFLMKGNANNCGGQFFQFYRANMPSYSEVYAMLLTAHVSGKTIEVVVSSCEGDRGVVNHIAIGE